MMLLRQLEACGTLVKPIFMLGGFTDGQLGPWDRTF